MKLSADLYQQALRFAGRAHGEQRVPGSALPYLVHLAGVASEVIAAATAAGDGDERFDLNLAATAALLHDTVEDTAITAADVEREFGPVVTQVVMALTKDAKLPKDEQMADSLGPDCAALPGPSSGGWRRSSSSPTALPTCRFPPAYWTRDKRLALSGRSAADLADPRPR